MLSVVLLGQSGCIQQYDDFIGAQEVASEARGVDGMSAEAQGGDIVLDSVQTDAPDPKDMIETVEPLDAVDTSDSVDACAPACADKACGADGCGGSCGTCDDGDPCTDDSCDAEQHCVHENNEAPCSDEDACTTGDTCIGGNCVTVGILPCDDGNPCTDNFCTSGVGCEYVPGNEGGLCESGLGICVQGTCCVPDCGVIECGDDGCVGSCGTCGNDEGCQNGQCVVNTWTDSTSDLTWQVTPTGGSMNWFDAKAHCTGLSLDGGGWLLPTISELRTLIRGCPAIQTGGACQVTDSCLSSSCLGDGDSCNGCPSADGPADGCYWPVEMYGICGEYWSSSSTGEGWGEDDFAWYVNFKGSNYGPSGVSFTYTDSNPIFVRCVR